MSDFNLNIFLHKLYLKYTLIQIVKTWISVQTYVIGT